MHNRHRMYEQLIQESLKISNQKSRDQKHFKNHLLSSKIQTKVMSPFGINKSNYSSFQKLLKIAAYVTSFIQKLKKNNVPQDAQTAEGIKKAQLKWIKYIQRKHNE